MSQIDSATPCPCGSGLEYGGCCGRFHGGMRPASAEDLMRSRYSAYVLERDDYLLATWHPDTRPSALRHEPGLRWLGLKINNHQVQDSAHASVSFETRYRIGGQRAVRMREISQFVRLAGQWFYLGGQLDELDSKASTRRG